MNAAQPLFAAFGISTVQGAGYWLLLAAFAVIGIFGVWEFLNQTRK
jgi:hypothetical protein